ncbi:MAG: dihydrodipicolinate synthase family protein [Pseudomonadota bacterium]
MTRDLHAGIHAVLYALFDQSEAIDHGAMAAEVDYCVAQGCHGITVLGLATEVLKLTFEERAGLIATVGRANAGRLPFSVTIAGNSVAEQIALSRHAANAGADWLILQPPMVGSYGADIYLDFFTRVARATTLPVAVQNAPQYLGRALSGEDLVRLSTQCPNLAAVKSEDAALGIRRIIDIAGGKLAVLGGRGGLEMTDCLRAGCSGFVLAPDIAPVAARIYDHWKAGRTAEADALYAATLPAATFVMQSLEHLVTYGKRIFAIQAGMAVHDRQPCQPPTEFGLVTAERWARRLAELIKSA